MASSSSSTPRKSPGIIRRLFKGNERPKEQEAPSTAFNGEKQRPLSPPTSPKVEAKHPASESGMCHCCTAKIGLRQSFRKSKCHGCQKKVCKKCRVVKKLCHKCVARQRVVSVKELLKMDCERLVTLLEQVHCEHGTIQAVKNDGDAMVRQLLTICDMKNTLMEFEKALTSAEHVNNTRNEAPQNKEVHGNGMFIDLHRRSMNQQQMAEAEAVPIIVNGHHEPPSADDDSSSKDLELLAIPQMDQIRTMEPPIPTPTHTGYGFGFLQDHVIPEEDESDDAAADPMMERLRNKLQQLRAESSEIDHSEFMDPVDESTTPRYVTPPQSPSARKSQQDIFYSTSDILEIDQTDSITVDDHRPTIKLDIKPKPSERRVKLIENEYVPYFNRLIEDLTLIKSVNEIRRLSLFQLKTILQKRGRPITGLITYEDFVQKVISIWEEEKSAKVEQMERERQLAEKEENLAKEEQLERLLEEEKRRMEEDKRRIEEFELLANAMEEAEMAKELAAQLKSEMALFEAEAAMDGVEMDTDDVEEVIDDVELAQLEAQIIQQSEEKEEADVSVKDQLELLDFEMVEVQLKIEEIEEARQQQQFVQHVTMTSYGLLPELLEVSEGSSSDEDELPGPPPPAIPPPKPPRPHTTTYTDAVQREVVEEEVTKEDGRRKCTGYDDQDLFS